MYHKHCLFVVTLHTVCSNKTDLGGNLPISAAVSCHSWGSCTGVVYGMWKGVAEACGRVWLRHMEGCG